MEISKETGKNQMLRWCVVYVHIIYTHCSFSGISYISEDKVGPRLFNHTCVALSVAVVQQTYEHVYNCKQDRKRRSTCGCIVEKCGAQ